MEGKKGKLRASEGVIFSGGNSSDWFGWRVTGRGVFPNSLEKFYFFGNKQGREGTIHM